MPDLTPTPETDPTDTDGTTTPEATSADTAPPAPDAPFRCSRRIDGWSGERQAAFLEHIADGLSVDTACRMVGLSATSAYTFRRRAAGAAFNLGWRAARLVARDKVADELMDRVFQGQTVTITRDDGSEVTRHQYDNRLAMALLNRLDRQAEAASDADSTAARIVAGEFDAYVDLIERAESAPARAGLFLSRRLPGGGKDARDLGPVLALASADRFARTGAATAGEIDISDLDAAARADWTAEQWQRAEAAGMLAIAAPTEPQHSQRSPDTDGAAAAGEDTDQEDPRVWWDDFGGCWKTDFPPDDAFYGKQEGEYGEEGYERELSEEEAEIVDAPHVAMIERMLQADGALRDAHFAELAQENGAPCDNPQVMLALAPPVEERH